MRDALNLGDPLNRQLTQRDNLNEKLRKADTMIQNTKSIRSLFSGFENVSFAKANTSDEESDEEGENNIDS